MQNYRLLVSELEHNPKSFTMHDVYMNLVRLLAMKSTCRRGHAGCVVVRHGRIIATGYNGSPPGAEECIDRDQCRQQGSKITLAMDIYSQPHEYTVKTEGCFDSIHGETNAFGYCSKHGIETDGCVVYLSGPPCKPCAQLMKAAGVKTIYYDDKYYRNEDGLIYAKTYGIELVKMIPEDQR